MPLSSDGSTIDKLHGRPDARPSRIHADHSAWQANPPSILEDVETRLP